MSRDSNGNYALPPGYLAVTGQTVQASQHNPPLEDIAQALTGSLPRSGVAGMLADLPMGGFKATDLAAGTATTDAANKGQVDAASPPVGAVIDFAGSTAPTGWLLCYGQTINRTTYAALFAVIGTTYGAGDGSTTFLLPDCRGRVVAGKDDMGGASASRLTNQTGGVNGNVLGGVGGVETHALTTAQLAAHTHTGTTVSAGAHSHPIDIYSGTGGGHVTGGASGALGTNGTDINSAGAHTHTFTSDATGSGAAHNNVQPTIIFSKIIRSGV